MDVIWVALAKVIEALFTKPENIALLVSIAVNAILFYFILVMRKEDRADRLAMTAALTTMAGAVDKLRIVVAAGLGNSDV